MDRKEMALQLMKENSMPPLDDNLESSENATQHPLGNYDVDDRTPLEAEFINLMSTFLTYSDQDIQSLTTTSTRYLHYHHHNAQQNEIDHSDNNNNNNKHPKRPRQRSREGGIRYRALYSGVQAASLEPEVLRSFTVLFEDYLPIRLAGRRIYGHLENVMKEVREERLGEIARVRELCPSWDGRVDTEEDVIIYARNTWDRIMDEALLREESVGESEESQEGGVISLSHIMDMGVGHVLIQEGLINDVSELECIVRQVVVQDAADNQKYYNPKKEPDAKHTNEDGKDLEMTFPIFMKALYQCAPQKEHHDGNYLMGVLQKVEEQALQQHQQQQHTGGLKDEDTSTILAAKAVYSGSGNTCKKRQSYNDRFDEYVSTFKLWEQKFLGNDISHDEAEAQLSRRMEILRGCFFGARNAKVVAALKIVYMDYAALRLAGDLIFKLMSKIAN
eukprot:CAMPEP_0183748970 /NCGR_PEP_ID=MMETSP0737-20130205/68045_1 /TAXON_ID=385413 /ORGANISM="Thalassiosira miniscula, Strain CCMP1093" /LENGTH=446 /DNA_ID=CAMNT_0025984713 /DNA_START=172 /DNA_END=1512 /DNA_ORIENTATION=+